LSSVAYIYSVVADYIFISPNYFEFLTLGIRFGRRILFLCPIFSKAILKHPLDQFFSFAFFQEFFRCLLGIWGICPAIFISFFGIFAE